MPRKKNPDSPFNQVAYSNQWNKDHYSEIKLQVHKGIRSKIQTRAAILGMSTNQYILSCIRAEMDAHNYPYDFDTPPTSSTPSSSPSSSSTPPDSPDSID
jgi:hypothetical protein